MADIAAAALPPSLAPPSRLSMSDIIAQLGDVLDCPSCHGPLTDPTLLPCGHSVCLDCPTPDAATPVPATTSAAPAEGEGAVPPSPSATPGRPRSGTVKGPARTCPVEGCQHKETRRKATVRDFKVDVSLYKVLEHLREAKRAIEVGDTASAGQAKPAEAETRGAGEDSKADDETTKRIHDPIDFESSKRHRGESAEPAPAGEAGADAPTEAEGVQAATPSEPFDELSELLELLECQICSELFDRPLTTPCGHSFCANCLSRALDSSDACPLCRNPFANVTVFQSQPVNVGLKKVIDIAFPALVLERTAALAAEAANTPHDTPLFVCNVAWPNLPTVLHVFEARYRLMMRRVMASETRMFGMIVHGQSGSAQYGTMLYITRSTLIADGRSVIESTGRWRFRVLETSMLDGYTVGKVQRIDDISEDEEAEAERVALATNNLPRAPLPLVTPTVGRASRSATAASAPTPIRTTEQLIDVCKEFVALLRRRIGNRLDQELGPMPSNPSDFSWWMAEFLPVDDQLKVELLAMRSARQRLSHIVSWVEQLRQSSISRGCNQM